MRELFDVEPLFVSMVEAGANRRKYKIFKSADYKEDEGLVNKVKEIVKNLFKKEGIPMVEKGKEAELEAQKKAKAEEERIKAEKDAGVKVEKEKAEAEAMKGKIAKAVEAVLLDKEKREELKGLIEKVEKNEEIKPEEMTRLKEALGVKTEEEPKEEMAKEIKELKARIKKIEDIKGIKKSINGQDGGQGEKKWPSFSA